MMELPRRSLEDLKTRYELEPSLNDLYVEGEFDKEIIGRLNIKRPGSSRAIYCIDTVDIPAELVRHHDLTEGNKQRVIALTRELAKIRGSQHTCFVDRDLDHWLGELENVNRLKWSKHTSIELYFLNEEFLREILLTTAKCKIADWHIFYTSFIETLKSIYSLRLADRNLDLKLSWVQLKKSLEFKNQIITFDMNSYIQKLPSSNPQLRNIDNFLKEVMIWRNKLRGDPKSYIRGHDLIYLIAWTVISSKGIKDFSSEDAISRLFVLLSDHASEIINCVYEKTNDQ